MANITEVRRDFTDMLRQGQFLAARDRFWAADVRSIEPHDLPDGTAAEGEGIDAARAKTIRWFGSRRIHDLSIDGPFVTGNQFALFLDMMIANQPSGWGPALHRNRHFHRPRRPNQRGEIFL